MNGWVVGYIIGAAVVVVVALLAITLIVQARKIGRQAGEIFEALIVARGNTMGLWEVDKVNRSLDSVKHSARTARIVLVEGAET